MSSPALKPTKKGKVPLRGSNHLLYICFVFITFAFVACATGPSVSVYDVPTADPIPDDRAVVIGRISFAAPPFTSRNASLRIDLIDANNGRKVVSWMFPPNGGNFAWLLPVGNYMILDAYSVGGPIIDQGNEISVIRSRFDVAKPRTVIFIGKIDITGATPHVYPDNEAARSFATQYQSINGLPTLAAVATIGPEKLEPFLDHGSFILPLVKPNIVPIAPKTTNGFFKGDLASRDYHPCAVESLSPLMKWSSENPSDNVFDLIIYSAVARAVGESVGFNGESLAVSYVPGIEVYYKEGLTSTEHLVEKQLEPGAVYVWAVRTRQGDKVGLWPKYSFNNGIPFFAPGSSGTNLWWQFMTPSPSKDASPRACG
jgi:hypothetical protein